jgi:hypothetical protein
MNIETKRECHFTNPLDDPDCYLALPPGFRYDIYGKVYKVEPETAASEIANEGATEIAATAAERQKEEVLSKDVEIVAVKSIAEDVPRKRCANCTCGAILGKIKRKAKGTKTT